MATTGFEDFYNGGSEPMTLPEKKSSSVERKWEYIFNRRKTKNQFRLGVRQPSGVRNSCALALGRIAMSEENGGSGRVGFFLAGLGIGAVIALLLAPRSGKETRDNIVQTAEEGRDFVVTKTDEIRKQAEDAVEKGKDLMNKQKDLLSAAVEAGKQAYQDEKIKTKQGA
jgi:gas vesicle protein